jgi:S1-C subfamily serine protease
MTRILTLLASLFLVGESFALPPCPTSGYKHNCYGTQTWAEGSKYIGEFKDDKIHGQGTYTSANGNKYIGEWKDNKYHGQGTYTYADGEKYVGEFKDNKYHGQGTLTFANGGKYVGGYKDNKRHGQGTLTFANGDKYVGGYKDNKRHGQGTYTNGKGQREGDKYVGGYKDNKRHGQGTYTFANGRKYVGGFKDGREWEGIRFLASGKLWGTVSGGKPCDSCKPTARQLAIVRQINSGQTATILPPCPTERYKRWCFGTRTFASGDKYVGEYKNDKFHGQGTYTWANGNKYVGGFKDNNKHGQGTYTYANGNKYVGEWRDDMEHGQGTLIWADGDKYVGGFKDGKRRGQGTYTWPDGTKYVGKWKYNKPHGQGTYTFAGGGKYVGKHKDGKRHGQGTYTSANGRKYVGEFKDGAPSEGVNYSASGQVQGTYSNGERCGGCKPTARQLAIVREINSGQIATIQTPQQKPTLTIKSNPAYASVYIDNAYKSTTPLKIQLAPNYYSIRVSKNGYDNFSQRIELDEDMVLWASLSKTKESKPESGRKLIGTGTGFVVNKYYVVTAEHVLEDCNAVNIRHGNRKIGAQTVATDTSNDLGLIRLKKPIGNAAKLRGGKRVRLGERVVNYGYPLFGQLSTSATITEGNINNLSGAGNDSTVFQFDAPTQPGNSGGPLLDSSGNVVGVAIKILSKKYADATGHIAQNVNFAVKSNVVEGFLQSNNIPFQTAASTENLELPDIAEKAETFTVFVGCWE